MGGLAILMAGSAMAASVQDVSERYRKLVLAIGQHDSSYVDAYYGPPELEQQAAKDKQSLASIKAGVVAAQRDIAQQKPGGAEEALRIEFLAKQLKAMQARVEKLEGSKFRFDEETALLYDAVTQHHDRA